VTWQRTLPIAWLCEAESSADRARELLGVLQDAPALTTALLEPHHPFCSLTWEPSPGRLRVQLSRTARARVALELTGRFCKEVETVRMRTADVVGAVSAVVSLTDPGNHCRREVELEFEDFGKRQVFSFEPRKYWAEGTEFTSARMQIEVLRKIAKANRAPAPAAPCLPPHYCRD